MTTLHDELREILATKVRELFRDYGVACSEEPSEADGRLLCGILGFTGDRLCGSVVISASPEAVAGSNPIRDGATRGWIAELTNQIVGRFKNALLRCGVELAMSIPVVLTATQLTPLPQAAADPIRLTVAGAPLAIWLEIDAARDLVLDASGADATVGIEGDALMF